VLTRHLDMPTPESQVAGFLVANEGLPFCLPCVGQAVRLGTGVVVAAAASLVGSDRFKLTNRCCARCFSEQAVIYLGMK
jgi:hypothetical protein